MYLQIIRRLNVTICDKAILLKRTKQFHTNNKINTTNLTTTFSSLAFQRGIHKTIFKLSSSSSSFLTKQLSNLNMDLSAGAISPKESSPSDSGGGGGGGVGGVGGVGALSNNSFNYDTPVTSTSSIVRVNSLKKSPQDNRDYRGLLLENGLNVLLVSDPITDKSAAALTVDVGHMCDPDYLPGLAHFCEHMLFLGTKKYPNENAYSTYLQENGGSSNASTYADNTKYYFDVVHGKFEGALDRFAQFFISPLFTESATDRELNAVNSEHEKNLATDLWRIRQVNKSLAKSTHPYNRFGTGNKKTLYTEPMEKGINVRDELIRFHEKWYSANIMHLAVYGKESLDDLETMVIEKFSKIVSNNIERPKWTEHPYSEDNFQTKLYVVPIKDSRALTITFPTGDLNKYHKSAPDQYLSHLIGHEGKGSILSELKEQGWCNSLMAGHSSAARGFGFFDVMVDLTKEGFENVDQIIKIIFQYITLLKDDEPKRWIFDEYCSLSEMHFRFKDKESPLSFVSNVVHAMQIYPIDEVLSAPYLITEWRPDLINDLLKTSLLPEKSRIIVVGQKNESIADKTEHWYGTKYHLECVPKEIVADWGNCGYNDNLKFPEPNPFISTEFDLLPIETDGQKFPIILYDTPVMRVWFKQDTEFLKPKTIMNFDFSSPMAYADPLNCNLTHMFVQLFNDQTNEYLYEAELAGLRLGVANTAHGISLAISGYSHKQQVLLEKILDQIFNFEFDPKRFEIVKEQLSRTLKNFNTEQPYQHAIYYLALILTEHAWTKQELADAVVLITVERLQQYIKDFLSRMHVECFLHGNINKQKAMDLTGLIEQKLKTTNAITLPLLSRQLLLKREYKLVTGERYLFETKNEYHKTSCSELYLQCGVQNDRSNVFIDLVAQIVTEPCYNTLRTKEQLGYIVFCGSRKANGVQGIRFIVQSTKHPAYVEERIELFLTEMLNQLEAMSAEEFQRHKDALAAHKLEKPKRLSSQFQRYLNEISLQQYHFERADCEVTVLKTVTKDELIDFYKNFILPDAPVRHALSIRIISTADGGIGDPKLIATENEDGQNEESTTTATTTPVNDDTDRIIINDLATFKSSKELFPMVQPYINIHPKGGKSKL